VFDRMSVAYLVSDRIEPDPHWPVMDTATGSRTHVVIQANPTVMPRAYVVPGATIVPDHAGVILTSFVDIDPHRSVLMSHDPLSSLPAGKRQPFTVARWVSADPDGPTLAVTTEAPGLLVVADTWMPGWTARVDGKPTAVLRGNHAQRVITLTERGRHTIVMRYRPPGLFAGCAVSLVSLLGWGSFCGLLTFRSAARRRGTKAAVPLDRSVFRSTGMHSRPKVRSGWTVVSGGDGLH
jgi:hypothetical protein